MIKILAYAYNLLLIRLLLIFHPEVLFEKINQLPWYKDMLIKWTADLPCSDNHTVLEIGCATGVLSRRLAKLGLTINAVDYSEAMLEKARHYNTDGIEYIRADAGDLPFADNSFDCVIAASLLNVVKTPSSVLAEMVRVCKMGGCVSVLIPNKDIDHNKIEHLVGELNLQGFSHAALLTWHHYAPKADVNLIFELFADAGLKERQAATELGGMVITVTAIKP